jgi:signal transduction histidine kinase
MFLALLIVLFFAAIVANYFWTSYYQHEQMENELVEKGEVLSQQMDAVWSFMSLNQSQLEKIAYTDDGVYRGLHCAIAGRSIGMLFSQSSNYTTRFVNFSPRNPDDTPDTFEADALNAFLADPAVTQYYSFSQLNEKEVFRYSAPMLAQETCLTCHGTPAGTVDVVGYEKEGWRVGDIGGAISIVIPLDVYMESQQTTVVYNIIFFGVLLLLFALCIWFALSYLVTGPLRKIQGSVKQTNVGELDIRLAPSETSREIRAFADELNDMSVKLAEVYGNLEAQVTDRTLQLTEANELLVGQRMQLEHMNSYLAEQSRYKSDFLAMMSHELRTPLTSIIAFTSLLKKNAVCQNDRDLAEISLEIESNSNVLLTIINDILDMSRIEAGKAVLNLVLVDFGDLVSEIKSFMQPIAEHKKINLSYEVKHNVPLAFVDDDKLHHIMVNLLSNAIKFTAEGGKVSLKVSYDEAGAENSSRSHYDSSDASQRGGSWIVLEVTDTGIGIARENQREIFERFWQVDSSVARSYSGTGLGLALVKEYAEMHGGSVAVESTLGEGSSFTVRIRARQEKC